MKHRSSLGFFFVFAALIVVVAGLWSQWLQTLALRAELESARVELGELVRLRAENQRLRAQQIPVAQLAAMRADHAALPRLRAELEALNKPTAP